MAEPNPTMERLLSVLERAGAKRVVDAGCGGGALARSLADRGFDVFGIDPQARLIEAARARCPAARFEVGSAEAMPLPEGSQDAVVFLNALHHVPEAAMQPSLIESLRVLRPGGVLVVIEPLAEGPFFEAMRPIDDETVIRAQAIRALQAVRGGGAVETVLDERYDRESRFDDVDAFVRSVAAVDPDREELARQRRAEIEDSFHRHATQKDGRYHLVQPLFIVTLRKPG